MRNYLFFLSLFLVFTSASAGEISDSLLLKTACELLETDVFNIADEYNNCIVITPSNTKGFVVISKKEPQRILGFSKESFWMKDLLPPFLPNLVNNITRPYKESKIDRPRQSTDPLLTTRWHQNQPFNNYSPIISDGNIKTAAGCVAIAAAQIVYYWWHDNPEATLCDTPTYPYGKAPVLFSIPKGTPNEWSLIKDFYVPDDTSESKDAVARLCYVIGTTSYLKFGSSTGGQINDAANALYSQYRLLSSYLSRSNCSFEQWDSLMYTNITAGRPIMCAGGNKDGAHAFVIDGYDADMDLYHFNFGWGGNGDGYYAIDNSQDSMGGYNDNQSIVYNIHPQHRNIQTEIILNNDFHDKFVVKISVINESTLPVKLSLYSIVEGNDFCCWQQSVKNQNEETFYIDVDEIPFSNDILDLKLYDEDNVLLSTFKESLPLTDGIQSYKKSQGKSVYNICGFREYITNLHGLYIIKTGGKIRKTIM